MHRDKAISITHIDLPQWSRVLHPKQMIHALVERQETQVYREVHPEEKTSLRRKEVNCLVRRIGQRKNLRPSRAIEPQIFMSKGCAGDSIWITHFLYLENLF